MHIESGFIAIALVAFALLLLARGMAKERKSLMSLVLSSFDEKAIRDAVGKVEREANIEVVPVFATRSYDWLRLRLIVTFGVAVIATVLGLLFNVDTAWGIYVNVTSVLIWTIGGAIAGWFLFWKAVYDETSIASRIEKDAARLFAKHIKGRTHDGVGVLIVVYLRERIVRVLPDARIGNAYSWNHVLDNMRASLRINRHAEAMVDGIELVGAMLKADFPPHEHDTNEIGDEVVREER
ncbi:MAG: hypothetical protein ABIH41_07285 [Nanoarchaeota archaeon]